MKKKEKILVGVIGLTMAAITIMLLSHTNNEFIKDCTSMGYSESYCMTKA